MLAGATIAPPLPPVQTLLSDALGPPVAARLDSDRRPPDSGAMPDFWRDSGYHLLRQEPETGHLAVTDDFLGAYFRRPEIRPVEESCAAEIALHRSLLANPREAVSEARLAELADPDAREKIWKAKVQTAKSARFVGGQAIQLHGGMGMTDELAIGHYYKRLTMCETMFGDGDWYLGQLAEKGGAQ